MVLGLKADRPLDCFSYETWKTQFSDEVSQPEKHQPYKWCNFIESDRVRPAQCDDPIGGIKAEGQSIDKESLKKINAITHHYSSRFHAEVDGSRCDRDEDVPTVNEAERTAAESNLLFVERHPRWVCVFQREHDRLHDAVQICRGRDINIDRVTAGERK